MDIYEIMKRNESDEGTFSEDKINTISELTGKSKDELFEIYNSGRQSTIPAGNPSQWKRADKLKYLENHSADDYKKLVNERK